MSFSQFSLVNSENVFCVYAEMVDYMKKVAEMSVELTIEERNLLSVAYKNKIGARRASWRMASGVEQKEKKKPSHDPLKLKLMKEYREKVPDYGPIS